MRSDGSDRFGQPPPVCLEKLKNSQLLLKKRHAQKKANYMEKERLCKCPVCALLRSLLDLDP